MIRESYPKELFEMSQVIVRFAPSPTGYLHIGNARAAVLNWLYAHHHGGRFILRLDDTDQERSTEAFAQGILTDLAWLGLPHATMARQSERLDHYRESAEQLKKLGRLYPCYETPEELNLKRKQHLACKRPPLYDRAALTLTEAQKQAYEAEGRRPHWRFLLADEPITWHDLIRGPMTFQGKHLSDPVLVRADGQPVYTLASVVDDKDMGITHIIRGEDHLTNSAVQIQIWKALGKDPNTLHLAHFPLIVDSSGAGFSKREGSLSLASLRDQGIEPMTLCSLLAHLGSSHDMRPYPNLDMLAQDFHLEDISKNPPHFDLGMLTAMNHAWYGAISFDQIKGSLQAQYPLLNEEAWTLIRDNITTRHDISTWYAIVFGQIQPAQEDHAFTQDAWETFEKAHKETEDFWAMWIQALKQTTGKQGAALMKPLRRLLTHRDHGPELNHLVRLMGHDTIRERLKASLNLK